MNDRTLRSILEDEQVPSRSVIFKELNQNKEFREQYARAREVQADMEFDENREIADTPQIGEIVTERRIRSEDGEETESVIVEVKKVDMLEHRRLRIDVRKWRASKMRPKVYGSNYKAEEEDDGQDVTITGGLPD